jgi:hypothetical protein
VKCGDKREYPIVQCMLWMYRFPNHSQAERRGREPPPPAPCESQLHKLIETALR